MRPPIRIFVALCLFVSTVAVSSVVYLHADGLSPGQQAELVMQNTISPAEVAPLYVVLHPDEALVPHGVPPVLSAGIQREVIPQCNSPGLL